MTYENWLDLYKEIGMLEHKIITGRKVWMEQGLGSGFSYHIYHIKVESYRKKWNLLVNLGEEALTEKFQEEVRELAMERLEKIRIQAMINRDDFPEAEEVKQQAEEIIQEAEKLINDCIAAHTKRT